MKFLLWMMVVTLSNAGRIPRSLDTRTHHTFPNLQTVHHGHGATSYQHVQIQNQGKIPIPTKFRTPDHYVYPEEHHYELQYEVDSVTAVPYLIDDDIKNHFLLPDDAEAFTSNDIEHDDINDTAEPSHYYDHYDEEYDYGYH